VSPIILGGPKSPLNERGTAVPRRIRNAIPILFGFGVLLGLQPSQAEAHSRVFATRYVTRQESILLNMTGLGGSGYGDTPTYVRGSVSCTLINRGHHVRCRATTNGFRSEVPGAPRGGVKLTMIHHRVTEKTVRIAFFVRGRLVDELHIRYAWW
jgi:hypothetical protein